ncbi:hypothetical protein EBU99_04750 [bacterium]|nr:hypothetical protein [bacterium]
MRLAHACSTLVSAFSLMAFSACSALKTVDKVEKSTAEVGQKMDKTNDSIDDTNRKMDGMRRQMGDMNDKLIETNKRIENMNRSLDRMYQDLRQGDSLAARLRTIEQLEKASVLKGKTVFAAQYFMSFEYQLWKGEGSDSDARLNDLKQVAVDEFIQTLRRYTDSTLSVSAMSEDSNLQSLEALAISMHMVNANAAADLSQKGISVVSMHDIFKQSLAYGDDLKNGRIKLEAIPVYAQTALREPKLLKYLLELRINMLPAIVVSELSNAASDRFLDKWSSRAALWLKPWNAQLAGKNDLQLKEYCEWLAWANSDVAALKLIDEPIRFDAGLVKMLRNLRLYGELPQAENQNSSRTEAFSEFRGELNRFLSELPK